MEDVRRRVRRAALSLFLAFCPAAYGQQPPAGPPPAVSVAPVKSEPVAAGLNFLGRVEAVDKVDIRARVNGFLQEQKFGDGEEVEAGDLLFLIEPDVYAAQVEQRKADLASARANAANARAQLGRTEQLAKKDFASRALLDQRQAEAGQATASVSQAEAALKQAEINLGYTRITAPIDGRISQAVFTRGAYVGPDVGALATIVSQEPMHVVFPVAERVLLEVRRRAAERKQTTLKIDVRLTLADGSQYPHVGKVDFTGVTVDSSTDTVDVRAVFPNPERLLIDGSFVRVRAEEADPDMTLVIPQSAVLNDQQGAYVFVVSQDETAEQRRVTLGQTREGEVVVEQGLREGEQVIVEGVQKVRPGAKVDAAPVRD